MRLGKDGHVNLKTITDFIGVAEMNFTNIWKKVVHTGKDFGDMLEETKIRLRHQHRPFKHALVNFLGADWDDNWSQTEEQ